MRENGTLTYIQSNRYVSCSNSDSQEIKLIFNVDLSFVMKDFIHTLQVIYCDNIYFTFLFSWNSLKVLSFPFFLRRATPWSLWSQHKQQCYKSLLELGIPRLSWLYRKVLGNNWWRSHSCFKASLQDNEQYSAWGPEGIYSVCGASKSCRDEWHCRSHLGTGKDFNRWSRYAYVYKRYLEFAR